MIIMDRSADIDGVPLSADDSLQRNVTAKRTPDRKESFTVGVHYVCNGVPPGKT